MATRDVGRTVRRVLLVERKSHQTELADAETRHREAVNNVTQRAKRAEMQNEILVGILVAEATAALQLAV